MRDIFVVDPDHATGSALSLILVSVTGLVVLAILVELVLLAAARWVPRCREWVSK